MVILTEVWGKNVGMGTATVTGTTAGPKDWQMMTAMRKMLIKLVGAAPNREACSAGV